MKLQNGKNPTEMYWKSEEFELELTSSTMQKANILLFK
jgi:hypothetical protein